MQRRRNRNANVSTSAMSREERKMVAALTIKLPVASQHGNAKSNVWQYFGQLCNENGLVLDNERYYCTLCLDEVKKSPSDKQHISSVQNYKVTTSSGNLVTHLAVKHQLEDVKDEAINRVTNYFRAHASATPCNSSHELNREFSLWCCRDLLPFTFVEKDGFRDFMARNFPAVSLPCSNTLAGESLLDIFLTTKSLIKKYVQPLKSVCVMFDGWTDRYKCKPYVAVRIAFIKNWEFKVLTLSCRPLSSHTGEALAEHVRSVLTEFFPSLRNMMLTTCHDGASNMKKASILLRSEEYQHCVAHCLHLLLSSDGISRVPELVALFEKCKKIVSVLHFKGMLIDDEVMSSADRAMLDRMAAKIADTQELLELDEQFSITDDEIEGSGSSSELEATEHRHQTVKNSCPTRWNSILTMISSIIDLKTEVDGALKRSGNLTLCLRNDELDLLEDVKCFLKPFEDLTELVSTTGLTLSLVPLMKIRVKKLCAPNGTDDAALKTLKTLVLNSVNNRLQETETCSVVQILNPNTKLLRTKSAALDLLKPIVNRLKERQLIADSLNDYSADQNNSLNSVSASSDDATITANSCDVMGKRRRLHMELLNEMTAAGVDSTQVSK